jgi:hypothetical protein
VEWGGTSPGSEVANSSTTRYFADAHGVRLVM